MRNLLLLFALLPSFWAAACMGPAQQPDARIAVAANFRAAAEALETVFEMRSGYDIEIVSGSTGQLYSQILNGAPYDVFLAADQAFPARLEEAGQSVDGSRFTYATGKLYIWSVDPALLQVNGEEVLRAGSFRKLAIANPELAPYGAAAMEVIASLGLDAALEPKLVQGQSVSQAFTLVSTGNAELGFVALSQIVEAGGTGSLWEPPAGSYAPIQQDAVLLTRAESNIAAKGFLDFLKSEFAESIIILNGYEVGE